jgi:hypothetical protein
MEYLILRHPSSGAVMTILEAGASIPEVFADQALLIERVGVPTTLQGQPVPVLYSYVATQMYQDGVWTDMHEAGHGLVTGIDVGTAVSVNGIGVNQQIPPAFRCWMRVTSGGTVRHARVWMRVWATSAEQARPVLLRGLQLVRHCDGLWEPDVRRRWGTGTGTWVTAGHITHDVCTVHRPVAMPVPTSTQHDGYMTPL